VLVEETGNYMSHTDHASLMNLEALRQNLQKLMDPKVLDHFASLLEAMNNENGSLLERYQFFANKNGQDCRYAVMAKEFFEKDYASDCATAINWLYHNWSQEQEKR
jgi:hypothetical protein